MNTTTATSMDLPTENFIFLTAFQKYFTSFLKLNF